MGILLFQSGYFAIVQDVIVAWPQWTMVLIFITLHTLITFTVNVPECGRGYIGPGGLHDGGKYYNCTGGVAGYIDRTVFGEHIYNHPTCKKVYETTVHYDPEGNIFQYHIITFKNYYYLLVPNTFK